MRSLLQQILKHWLLILKISLKSALFLTAAGIIIWQSQVKNGESETPKRFMAETKDWEETEMKPIVALCPKPISRTVGST